jgi:hypothetical protein
MAYLPTRIFSLPQGNLCIQSAQAADTEEFLSIMQRTNNETDFLARGSGELDLSFEDERRFIENKLALPKEILLTARLNGKMAGTLGFSSSPLLRYSHKGSFGISILKEYWGR